MTRETGSCRERDYVTVTDGLIAAGAARAQESTTVPVPALYVRLEMRQVAADRFTTVVGADD
jgi:hypothetical protein